jgi:pyridoxamine 5'-phosphate oxidase
MKTKDFSINSSISTMRTDYDKEQPLLEENCHMDPFKQFESWLKEAVLKDLAFANAMALSTVDRQGMPDSRIMLLRNISYGGFTFFSNYKSKKAGDIENNSKASLLFFWKELQRQVRIQGEIKFLPTSESDAYFATRPFESQVGAWASQQSSVISGREALDKAYDAELKNYEQNKSVPRPQHWGGYVLVPSNFEFWQGRSGRLHDRLKYEYDNNAKTWYIRRLMP